MILKCANEQVERGNLKEYAIVSLGFQQSRVGFFPLDVGKLGEHMMFNHIRIDVRIAHAARAEYFNFDVQSHYNLSQVETHTKVIANLNLEFPFNL